MPVSKIDPKVIFASEAPTQDTPAVFTNKTVGWGESRKNGGRPTIKQSNALQQETDLKILWLNENSVTPYDASIDYPVNAVTIKDGAFKIFNGSVWNLFLNKSSVGLNNVDNTSDLNKPVSTATQDSFDEIYESGACLPYDPTITYVLGSLVLRDGIIQKVVTGGTEPLIGNTDAVKVIDGNQTQKEINLYGGKKYDMPVGGYPLNSIVLLDSGSLVRSTISNNTNNPNTLLTGWVKTNAASQLFTEGGQTLQSVADEARPVTKGGTGATTAEEARINLDVYSKADVDTLVGNELLYMPIPYPKSTPPVGYLVLMGQSINQVTYPILFSLYGGTLPDMRAYSVRGLDYGRGIDVGRTVLSLQEDAIRNIKGALSTGAYNPGASGVFVDQGTYGTRPDGSSRAAISIGFDASRVVPTASENIVKNIAFLYIVKAG